MSYSLVDIIESVPKTLANYFNFSGRASRFEFWIYTAFYLFTVTFVLAGINTLARPYIGDAVDIIQAILFYVLFGAYFSLFIRRMHDVDIPAKRLWASFIIGIEVFYAATCLPGSVGPNQFGKDPQPYL